MATTAIDGTRQIKPGTITDASIAAAAAIADSKLARGYIDATGQRAFTADQSMGGNKLTSVGAGINPSDAVNLAQLQAAIRNQDIKDSVRAATNGSETYTIAGGAVTQIAGTTIDGFTAAVGDRFLVKNAPNASGAGVADAGSSGSNQPANGLYVVTAIGSNITVARTVDADAQSEVTAGATVWVDQGTYGDTQWTLATNDPLTLGTSALQWMKTGGASLSADGTTIVQTGNTLSRGALTGDVGASAGSTATTIQPGAVTLAKQAALAAATVIGNLSGSAATPVAVPATAAPTPNSVLVRDASGNVKVNGLARGVATTATAGGTTTLVVGSAQFQQFTGTSSQIVVLPDATTMMTGSTFTLANRSTAALTVNLNGGGALGIIAAGSQAIVTLVTNGTAAGTWDITGTVAAGLQASNFVTRETPSGTINGSNVTHTLAFTPVAGTEHVYVNGILQEPGSGNDYSISGNTITMAVALTGGANPDKLRVSYQK